jgi:predicted Holliday junction resolvase-like endonuclease
MIGWSLLILAIVVVLAVVLLTFQRNRRRKFGEDLDKEAGTVVDYADRVHEQPDQTPLDALAETHERLRVVSEIGRRDELQRLNGVPREDYERELATLRSEHENLMNVACAEHKQELEDALHQAAQMVVEKQNAMELDFEQRKAKLRKDNAAASRVALVAKISEHFAPLLEGFPYNFKDVRHVGELFDFLVFDGLEEGKIRRVVFLEVKTRRTGARVANKRERMLRDAIQAGRVEYEIYVPQVDGAKDDA